MLDTLWQEFIKELEKIYQKNIVVQLLKQSQPIELKEDTIILRCNNQGTKMYLEKKQQLVGTLLFNHFKKHLRVELILAERKPKEEPPLLRFEPSPNDLLAKSGLHTKYTFENFAVSSSNQVAFAASQAVAKTPGSAYNPLFLYGGVGVGKTHLAQATARYILEKDQTKKVYFCSSEHFTNEFIESLQQKATAKFRNKYRRLNLLIIDDIQFIAGKQGVQEDFFHTFNSLVSAGAQIILTSDRPPTEIKHLEDRLRSRFSGGLIVDIQPPDFELRTAILLIKAKEKNIEIDMEAAQIIAEQVQDTRAIEGTLLSTYAKILGKKDRIDLDAVEEFFEEKITSQVNKKINPNDVIRLVCSAYNVKQSHLKSSTRADEIALPRQIVMYLLRIELKLNLIDIAEILKRKDHTTVMHGVDKINRLLLKDPFFKQELDKIISSLRSST